MLQKVISTTNTFSSGSLHFDEPSNSVWATTTEGEIVTARMLGDKIQIIGSGYQQPVAAIPTSDGLTVAVVEQSGQIWWARRDAASRGNAVKVALVPGTALAARQHPDSGKLLVLKSAGVEADDGPALWICTPADGTLEMLATELSGAVTFSVDKASRTVSVVTAQGDDSRRLVIISLDDGLIEREIDGIPTFEHIVSSINPSNSGVIGTYDDAGQLGKLLFIAADGKRGSTTDLSQSICGITRWGSLVVVASASKLIAIEWDLDPGPFEIEFSLAPVFVNGYVRFDIDPQAFGLTIEDLKFTVLEGEDCGIVSAGRESANANGTQPMALVVGRVPGEYHLEITHKMDGSRLAQRRFRVVSCWPDRKLGPPVALTGANQSYRLMNWGGSGALDELSPAPSVFNVMVVLVSLNDRRWNGLEVGAKVAWKNRVIGTGVSAKRYFEEVSFHNTSGPNSRRGMTVDLVGTKIYGPIDLDFGWGDVFEPKDAGNVHAGWVTKPTGFAILADAISEYFADLPDGANVMKRRDTMVIVVRSGSDSPTPMPSSTDIPTRYVWGHANVAKFYRKTMANGVSSTTQEPATSVTIMTSNYPKGLAVVPILTHTLCHELGHNLGLDDLYDANKDYPPEINVRSPAGADLMASNRPLPHFSLGNRVRLGWVDRTWLRRFDFSASPTGDSVVLQATETLTRSGPDLGRFAGIEIPVTDGWSYLFEFRRTQGSQIGDQELYTLAAGSAFVLGTDVRHSEGESARPPILFLPKDVDGDGPVLDTAAANYRDSDTTNPKRMHDFALTLSQLGIPDADSAQVNVSYLAAHRPQLLIHSARGHGDFKSQDIELMGPFGLSVSGVLKGMPNVIKITVHNLGTLAASAVQTHVKWLPFSVSAGAWISLPDPAPFSVPARGSTSFVVPWDVPKSIKVKDVEAEHFCVRVEIDRYKDLGHPDNEEIVIADNWAQSNFDAVTIPFGSPSQRIRTAISATNSLTRDATYLFTADQSSHWYRVFIGHAWLHMEVEETQPIELAYESLAGDAMFGREFERNLDQIATEDNHVAIMSWLLPKNTECDTPREWWGVGLNLRVGRKAWVEDVTRNGEIISAVLRSRNNNVISAIQFGELYLAAWPEDAPDKVVRTQGQIDSNGIGRVSISNETMLDFQSGRSIIFSLARPSDKTYSQAITEPARMD